MPRLSGELLAASGTLVFMLEALSSLQVQGSHTACGGGTVCLGPATRLNAVSCLTNMRAVKD